MVVGVSLALVVVMDGIVVSVVGDGKDVGNGVVVVVEFDAVDKVSGISVVDDGGSDDSFVGEGDDSSVVVASEVVAVVEVNSSIID